MIKKIPTSLHSTIGAPTTSIDTFECTLMTYNLWGLPVWVPRSDQKNRFKRLSEVLVTRDENILCLQETFNKNLRKQLIPSLTKEFYAFSDYSISKRIYGLVPIDRKGGLMTLSKYPILEEKFFEYPVNKKMRFEERFARKGFIWSKIKSPGGIIHVLNTHLYANGNSASEAQRLLQIQYLKKVVDSIPGFYDVPVVLLGDINICHPYVSQKYPHRQASYVYDYLLTEMGFIDSMPEICDDDCTIHFHKNKYVPVNNDLQKLDYCFLRVPENYDYEILHQAPIFDGAEAMSDHMAWVTKVKWSRRQKMAMKGPINENS